MGRTDPNTVRKLQEAAKRGQEQVAAIAIELRRIYLRLPAGEVRDACLRLAKLVGFTLDTSEPQSKQEDDSDIYQMFTQLQWLVDARHSADEEVMATLSLLEGYCVSENLAPFDEFERLDDSDDSWSNDSDEDEDLPW